MQNVRIPNEIRLSQLVASASLSPSNYRELSIPRKKQVPLRALLLEGKPYDKGFEPGSVAYVRHSDLLFYRNSCISDEAMSADERKALCLNPFIEVEHALVNDDVLLCKDANVGDACIFLTETDKAATFSSGIVRLNPGGSVDKYALLAVLRDSYFREQLDALSPRGSTIAHAGDKFLDCMIPEFEPGEELVLNAISNLIRNIVFAERSCGARMKEALCLLRKELEVKSNSCNTTTLSEIKSYGRLDAGLYSAGVKSMLSAFSDYRRGSAPLEGYGFKLLRGPNLAKRDLGRSIQTTEMRAGYTMLIYPSDIVEDGYVGNTRFLGAAGATWTLGAGDVLFSAEGTVGKVFVVCDSTMSFTTNFHGIIIRPKESGTIIRSVVVGFLLALLREEGVLDRISVGGQGGSFAVSYWDILKFPLLEDKLENALGRLYHNPQKLDPLVYSPRKLNAAGIYQLSNFRVLCLSLLATLLSGVKQAPSAGMRALERVKSLSVGEQLR